ncbi:unnamed protein product [Durusdinium trenchii]|uniref:Uncharacterized protein n=1 Tax=Durusdinium trenchii TaxID=1381693 RepID=A0ABP0M779_9DINO
MIIPPAAGQGARLPAPQATFSGSVPEPDSEVAPPEDDVPLAPWAAARVLPTSHARRTRRVSTPAGRFVGDEQKQLARWAEHLNEEVLALTRERDSLAGKLADANAANVKLQMELEHLRRVSAEFERLGGGDVGVLNAIVETRDLEKQLQASTAEVQELRTERKGIDAAHAFSQQMVQQLHKEMEELRGRHKNLQDQYENCKAECSRLNDLHGSEREHRRRLESHLQNQSSDKEAAASARQEFFQKEHRKAWDDLQRAHWVEKEKDARFQSITQLAQDAIALVSELQDGFVEQTKKYNELSKSVRNQQRELTSDVQEAQQLAQLSEQFALELRQLLGRTRETNSVGEEQWRQEAHKLEDQLRNLTLHHREAAKTVRELRKADDHHKVQQSERMQAEKERQERKRERHELFSNPNIVRQMAQAVAGIEVYKVDEKNRREKRRLRVVCDIKSGRGGPRPDLQLRWSKAPYRDWPDRSSCDLTQVVSLGYGFASRATWLFKDVPPYHCFSVQTPYRTFDFICSSDRDVEALVLVISRLCTRSQGWPLYGGVHSHARFVAMKGWTKVQVACRASKNTLSTHLLEAVAKMQSSSRPSHLPPPPSETEVESEDPSQQSLETG